MRCSIRVASEIAVDGPHDVGVVDDEVDDPLEVGVVARDDPDEQVAGAGDRMRLEHLRDGGQVLDDRAVPPPWRISRVQNAVTG